MTSIFGLMALFIAVTLLVVAGLVALLRRRRGAGRQGQAVPPSAPEEN